MTKDIESIDESLFESIKHINEYGMEYWTARELLKVLQYGEYRFFSKVIDKAIDACIASKNDVRDHFVHVHEMVNIGSSAKRRLDDYHLSRYACYLIAMNGDPRKEAVALAQTYFAVKTRQQELSENFERLFSFTPHFAGLRKMGKQNGNLRFLQIATCRNSKASHKKQPFP